jgi:hypothetical protein
MDEQAFVVDDLDYWPDSFLWELWGSSCQGTVPEEDRAVIGLDELCSLSNGEGSHTDGDGDWRGAVVDSHDDDFGGEKRALHATEEVAEREYVKLEDWYEWEQIACCWASRDEFQVEMMIV